MREKLYWTISKFSIRSLFYDYFVFFDTMPYLADQLFIRHEIKTEEVLNYTNSYARRVNMIYTPDTKKAIKLCFEAHRNQTDKSGLPYVFHPFHVAEQMPDEETTIVALLHDVIEDASYTLDDLRKMGFAEEVLDALDLMTHDKNVPYMEYVAKISENEIARTVKLADLRHNSDLTRLDEIDDKARNRIEKYKAAIRLLTESNTSFRPYYDKGADTWRVDFPDRDSEEGDLLYVASEYARTGLYFPYNVAVTAGKEYSGHAHSFEGVIQALLDDPAGFTIADLRISIQNRNKICSWIYEIS